MADLGAIGRPVNAALSALHHRARLANTSCFNIVRRLFETVRRASSRSQTPEHGASTRRSSFVNTVWSRLVAKAEKSFYCVWTQFVVSFLQFFISKRDLWAWYVWAQCAALENAGQQTFASSCDWLNERSPVSPELTAEGTWHKHFQFDCRRTGTFWKLFDGWNTTLKRIWRRNYWPRNQTASLQHPTARRLGLAMSRSASYAVRLHCSSPPSVPSLWSSPSIPVVSRRDGHRLAFATISGFPVLASSLSDCLSLASSRGCPPIWKMVSRPATAAACWRSRITAFYISLCLLTVLFDRHTSFNGFTSLPLWWLPSFSSLNY